ncbi:hypothetical protein [Mycoplasmopsis glycophila]|uniref:Uncharacterized protein n=1 Tax=Mycoplasmopsis glycophila TaxID=171285 RepID=A0A449AV06_9BACT|nr:hypothetical protein [Mycoplasmopsis glycophila]VEU70349.1 Uncharacterised protein [Mycoplasmopsis glycophila]
MKLKDTIFISLAPLITIPTSVAISSAINNSNETNTRILTFHNLPNEFYDLIKNTQIKRNIALDRDELLLAKYETKAIPLDTKSISIYYDAGFENTVRFLDNIADRDGRRIEITYDENIDFNSEEANKIKNRICSIRN